MSSKRHIRRSACGQKRAHADAAAAGAQLRSLAAAGKMDGHPMRVYHCAWCSHWHVGHVPHRSAA